MRLETTRPIDLLAAAVAALLLVAVVALLPDSPLRVALGLPFVLLLPGYVLVAALFPERPREVERDGARATDGIDALERVALSFGLSIAVVPLIGLALNHSPWGIRLAPVLAAVAAWVVLVGAVAAWRRARLPEAARLRLVVDVAWRWGSYSRLDKALTLALAVAVIAAAGALAHVATTPRAGEAFTEFYVLGPDGRAEGYPTRLAPGETGTVRVGVANREGDAAAYRVVATLTPGTLATDADGARRFEPSAAAAPLAAFDVALDDGTRWEEPWTFTAPDAPGTYRLGLDLERDGHAGAYRSLHLWVAVAR